MNLYRSENQQFVCITKYQILCRYYLTDYTTKLHIHSDKTFKDFYFSWITQLEESTFTLWSSVFLCAYLFCLFQMDYSENNG